MKSLKKYRECVYVDRSAECAAPPALLHPPHQPPPVAPPMSPPSQASAVLACSSYTKGHSAAGNLILLISTPPPPPGLLLSLVRYRRCHRDSVLFTQSHTARKGQSHGARFQCLWRGRGEPQLCPSTLSSHPRCPVTHKPLRQSWSAGPPLLYQILNCVNYPLLEAGP